MTASIRPQRSAPGAPSAMVDGPIRQEPCACGGTLRQAEHEDVRIVVERHNDTAAHRAWRAARQ